jgi:hypothetical protein
MGMMGIRVRASLVAVAMVPLAACGALTSLGALVQPPRFEQAEDRPAELRLMTPSRTHPLGGAGVTVWLDVTNPNPFGFTLSTLQATLLLEGARAATGDFPLGLPLAAGQTTTVPLDLAISFADVPGLAGVLRQAAAGEPLAYQVDGTVGIDAGRLGQPTFGPMMLMRGELAVPMVR